MSVSMVASCKTEAEFQPDQEARKSSDHQSVSRSYGETRSGNVDYGIPGVLHSTVQQRDTNRSETVNKFIQQFENTEQGVFPAGLK